MKHQLLIAAAAVSLMCSPAVAEPQRGPGPGARLSEAPGPSMGHGPGKAGRLPAGPAFGAPGPGSSFGLLQFDANADGKLTKAEFDAGQKSLFADIDGNKDGVSTPEERVAGMKIRREKMQAARFNALDTDKNGQLSQAELAAAGPGMFARIGGRDGGRPDRGPDRGPDRAGPDGKPRRAGPADVNTDGNLSFDEFAKRGLEAFTRADADKNGTVTIKELQALYPL